MSTESGGCVRLLSIPLKEGDDKDKVRRRVVKKLKQLEQHISSGSASDLTIRVLENLKADNVSRVVANSRYLVFLLKDGRVCRMRCHSRTEASGQQKATEEMLKKKARDTPFQLLSDAEYARQLQVEFDRERLLGGVHAHHSPLRSEDISPYIHVPSSDHNWEASIDPFIPSAHILPPPFPFLHEHSDDPPPTTAESPAPLPRPTGDRTRSHSRSVRFLLPDGGTREGGARGNGGWRQKEEAWPEMGGIQWLVMKKSPERSSSVDTLFSMVAVTHSEVLLVSAGSGLLYSWPCEEGVVSAKPHPLNAELGLKGERVTLLTSSEIRVSMVTESGKVATFYDPLLRTCSENGSPPLMSSLSHPATLFPALSNDHTHSIVVSDFITTVTLKSGRVFWWGLCPPGKTSSSSSTTTSNTRSTASSSLRGITDGCLVRLKNGPPCGPGALVLSCSKIHGPRVGKTVNIIEHSSLDPRTTILVKVLRQDLKSGKGAHLSANLPSMHSVPQFLDTSRLYEGLEVWKLSDVVFLDDSPAVLGRVVAIDNSQAIVDIAYSHKSGDASGSTAQSSLKVFRLSELEPCGVDVPLAPSTSLEGATISPPPTPHRGVSRHVAGIIQHHPVCLVDPAPSHTPLFYDDSTSASGHTILHGFTPLAVHPTNHGPLLLVKRTCDGKTFLVSSSHHHSGLLQTSSFIAVSGHGQRLPCSTVEDEGCNALEAGLTRNDDLWSVLKPVDLLVQPAEPPQRRKIGAKKRKRKTEAPTPPSPSARAEVVISSRSASFVDLHHPDVILLQDVHGIPAPILPGFSLRTPSPPSPGAKDSDKHSTPVVLTQPYVDLVSRLHDQDSKGKKALLIIAVPRSVSLLSAVVNGSANQVQQALISMAAGLSSAKAHGGSKSSPNCANSSDDASTAKRMHLDSSECENEDTSSENGDVDMIGDVSTKTDEEPKLESDIPSQVKPQPDSSAAASSMRTSLGSVGMHVLLEHSVHNNNVLHLCGGGGEVSDGVGGDSDEKKSAAKTFKPYCVPHFGSNVNRLSYQSLTADPDYQSLSFEELRFGELSRTARAARTTAAATAGVEESGTDLLSASRLAVLDCFLTCDPVRDVTMKLLCQKNTFGETPFMTAIANRNYSIASQILSYVTHSQSRLLEPAILAKNRDGMTPIQMLFASLTSHYDIHSMRLFVTNIPVGFTAQQLLQLFKDYYPSVYRAEIIRDSEEEGRSPAESSDSDSSANEEPTTGAETLFGGVVERARRRVRTRRRRRAQNGVLESGLPQKGVVFFSNVQQLRAAFCEMQDYRVFSNYSGSRGTFGQAHSVSFLTIKMELEDGDSDTDGDDGIPAILDMGHGIMSRMNTHRNRLLRMSRNGPQSRINQPRKQSKQFQPAAELLSALLSHSSVSSMVDSYGETVLCSLVHNPRCLQTLREPLMSGGSSSTSSLHSSVGYPVSLPPPPPPPLPSIYSDLVSLSNSINLSNALIMTEGPLLFEDTIGGWGRDHMIPEVGENQLELPQLRPFWRPFFSESTVTPPPPITSTTHPQPQASNASFFSSSTTTTSSPGTPPTLRFGAAEPQSVIRRAPPLSGISSPRKPADPSASRPGTGLLTASAVPNENINHVASSSTIDSSLTTDDVSMSEAPPTPHAREDKVTCTCTCGANAALATATLGRAMLLSAFTSWPCVVTTILGFCPSFLSSSGSTGKLSSVQILDDFVISLFLNCDKSLVSPLVFTIITHMNKDLESNADLSQVDLQGDLRGLTESNVALYVGVRFLKSVVRIMSLEHSRVKNMSVELPSQGRERRVRGQGENGKELLDNIRLTLTSFSWLAVEALAQAAETSSLPVRMGVSKPFGASSVTVEYQSRMSSSTRLHGRTPARANPLSRQLHIRSALWNSDSSTKAPVPSPPLTGLRLVPRQRDFPEASKDEDNSLQDDGEFGMDLSDSDLPVSDAGNDSFEGIQMSRHRPNVFLPRAYSPEEILIDFASSSDEDDLFADPALLGRGTGRHGNADGDDDSSFGDIYPYAWALDGRRIGENMPLARPASPSSSFMFGMSGETPTPLCSIPSIRFGAGFLARTYARIVKDLVDIAQSLSDQNQLNQLSQPLLNLPPATCQQLAHTAVTTLERTWQWVESVVDVAEGQLEKGQYYDTQRYVALLRGSAYSTNNSAVIQRILSRNASRSFIGSTPGEYITYLMRSMSGEDEGCLPVIDLYGYEHVVYILDSLIYTLTNWPKAATPTLPSPPPTTTDKPVAATLDFSEEADDAVMADEEDEESSAQDAREKQKSARFFERSESITIAQDEVQKSNEQFFGTPGSPGGQSSGPLQEAFPLAKQPHLLRSNAKKEQLFSNPRQPLLEVGGDKGGGESSDKPEERRSLPVSYSHLQQEHQQESIMLSWPVEKALQRWNTVIGVFAHIFLAEGPGSERSNFLNARAGFASRMSRFRHQISQLFDSNQTMRGDWASVSNTLSIRVRRDRLLEDSLDYLSNLSRFHYSQIRVKFEGEDGSGPGVNRGFFASLANALKSTDPTKHPCNKLGLLFYQPGKEPEQSGLYAPLPFKYPSSNSATKNSALRTQRLNMYKAVGRFLGLCFWFRHTIPFTVCRHVAKFLIGRELAWHDLAFFNAELYEGFRRMMLDAELGRMTKDEFQQVYCCYFEAPLSGQTSEPVFVDLVHDGSKIPVTPDRVQEYVRLYSMFVMVEGVKDELQAMRDGLTSIIPPEILEGLTAEDFQLLLAGDSANISLNRLKSVIKFNHTHGRPSHICERFEKMFWQVVSHMSNAQRQQLLYFATGSAALPASSDNEPSISITIDVIGGSNTDALPVASTCSQRMSIPLYPSYHTLKKKLLQAVQCQAYGLG